MGYDILFSPLPDFHKKINFQFPLWDTKVMQEGGGSSFFFQFPLWDTKYMPIIPEIPETFNSLYGILQEL